MKNLNTKKIRGENFSRENFFRTGIKAMFLIFLPLFLILSISCMSSSGGSEGGSNTATPVESGTVSPSATVTPTATVSPDVAVKINPMEEFDFKKKSEIYEIRKTYVNAYPQLVKLLVSGEYEPSDEIFGQIEDGKGWWGILGICYYGPGEQSIEGDSEESRFICNPFIPSAPAETRARKITDPDLEPKAIYPEPVSINWDTKNMIVTAKYDMTTYLKESEIYGYDYASEMKLVSYNAKDLGFLYFYIDSDESENVKINIQENATLIPQFIHVGFESGYPGGCNNMSPAFTPLIITVEKVPAKVTVKYWREMPGSVENSPDLKEILYLD